MRILFFGDGAWATNSLQRLVREDWTLLGVVVRAKPTDPSLLTTAQELQLPIFQPQRVNDPGFVTLVASLQSDPNLSVSYDQILRRPILEMATPRARGPVSGRGASGSSGYGQGMIFPLGCFLLWDPI